MDQEAPMDIAAQALPIQAHAFAILSKAAYLDDSERFFAKWHLNTNYKAINRKDANAHIGCNARQILITVRGTELEQLRDLVADLRWWPKSHGPGWVHTGFRAHARRIMPEISEYVGSHPGRSIYITGHSLGAAMSLYIAQELEWAGHDGITLFTYGSPRLGNSTYVRNLKNITHHRYVNGNDLVTKLPPALFGYRHHGTLHYINRNGVVTDRYTAWEQFRDGIKGRLRSWSQLKPLDGLRDHSMIEYIKHLDRAADL
jgi:triacylglycerol lipase